MLQTSLTCLPWGLLPTVSWSVVMVPVAVTVAAPAVKPRWSSQNSETRKHEGRKNDAEAVCNQPLKQRIAETKTCSAPVPTLRSPQRAISQVACPWPEPIVSPNQSKENSERTPLQTCWHWEPSCLRIWESTIERFGVYWSRHRGCPASWKAAKPFACLWRQVLAIWWRHTRLLTGQAVDTGPPDLVGQILQQKQNASWTWHWNTKTKKQAPNNKNHQWPMAASIIWG